MCFGKASRNRCGVYQRAQTQHHLKKNILLLNFYWKLLYPKGPSLKIIAREKYVSEYACKRNKPTGAIATFYDDMVKLVDETTETTVKSLCPKLPMDTFKHLYLQLNQPLKSHPYHYFDGITIFKQ